jgi:hypothetical protein
MIIKPFAELEAYAHAEYVRKYASIPRPNVVNIDAVLAFGQPRVFQLGGVGYRAPPLSFRLGFHCLVVANLLRDATAAGQSTIEPIRVARRLLLQAAFPVSRWMRWFGRRIAKAPAADIEPALWWLLHVPDALPPAPPTQQVTVDWSDQLAQFARAFPCWAGSDGFPLSWHHYVVGMRHLSRATAREDVRRAVAGRIAGADVKEWKSWKAELNAAAGW